MALLPRFDTPGFLPDFTDIPGQLDAWTRLSQGAREGALSARHGGPIQQSSQ